ncbi:MAG: hypothetical protein KDA99_04485 [Planctomycetales bacterium]|nr:hypothetical protein [Planctomycetales bacterium]
MQQYLAIADGILRHSGDDQAAQTRHRWRTLLTVLSVFAALFGLAVGSFGARILEPGTWLQALYSAIKLPILLTLSTALSLPSFFVINSLLGLRNDFDRVVQAIVLSQVVMAIVLASFAPMTILWYASSSDYSQAILANLVLMAIASFVARAVLRAQYRRLIVRNPRHRWMSRLWLATYAMVAVQMAWNLRPFVGSPGTEPQFLRPDMWDNAYVIVWKLIARSLGYTM